MDHLKVPGAQVPDAQVPDAPAADADVALRCQLEELGTLLDDDALSNRLGFPVRGRHLRIKPARSAVLAWERAEGGHSRSAGEDAAGDGAAEMDDAGSPGWILLTRDRAKGAKVLDRAQRSGLPVTIHREGAVFSGSVWSDHVLGRELAEARGCVETEGGLGALNAETAGGSWRFLRYNPRRRVVAGVGTPDGPQVVRVTGRDAGPQLEAAARWRRLGAPVSVPSRLGRRGTATITPQWGCGDLLTHPVHSGAVAAGAAIAALHQHPCPGTPLSADVTAAVGALAAIAPFLLPRAVKLAERLAPRLAAQSGGSAGLVELHGDLSPDQVLLATPEGGEVRLIDLDRAGPGPAMRDVGSWVASCRTAGLHGIDEAFLAGYRQIAPVDQDALGTWEAYAHLTAALDPFRRREQDWPQRTADRLAWAEHALAEQTLTERALTERALAEQQRAR